MLNFCTFLLNPHFDLGPNYIIRKPMKYRFQLYIVRTEILSTFHTRVSANNTCTQIVEDWTECAQTRTQTHTHTQTKKSKQ